MRTEFERKGWNKGSFRMPVGYDVGHIEWKMFAGWTNLSFCLCQITTTPPRCESVRLADVTHLPTGLRLIVTEELTDGALAAEIAEPPNLHPSCGIALAMTFMLPGARPALWNPGSAKSGIGRRLHDY
jgi:hypothetical protein